MIVGHLQGTVHTIQISDAKNGKLNVISAKKKQHPASYGFDNSRYNYNLKNLLFTAPERLVITPVSKWLGNEVKNSFLEIAILK